MYRRLYNDVRQHNEYPFNPSPHHTFPIIASMTPITPPHVLAARTAFLALEVESWSKTQTTYREQGERNTYKLVSDL